MSERDIFEAALAIDDPAQRAAYLGRACAGQPGLREHLDGLLSMDARAGSFLEAPAPAVTVDELPIPQGLGTVIGPYRLLEQIGEGGFGVVFMAEQLEPLRRQVALKIIKPGMDSRQVIARFEAERQALALMDHPNIATVLGAGQTTSGRPYFAMELVRGLPITEYCDQARLTPRERLELFLPVCRAVQHAHQKGIIHRDLKPSNVLVTLHDGAPLVKVIDFGIAKALGQQLTDKTLFTGFAQMVGTPLYMSPEQAALSHVAADTRSDIYSLGVLLYELLTGTTPFDEERLRQGGYDEWRRIIREEEPPRPSTRLSTLGQAAATVAAQRQTDSKRLRQVVRGELDWIAMKCLEKDRNRRYDTANGLALDVQRYLHDEPVQACPPSAGYRLRKFARRHKPGLVAAGFVLTALLAATALSVSQAIEATRARALAQERLEAEQQASRQALANLRKARNAVDQMLTEVAQVDLAHIPQMEPVRRALLEKALKFYEGFLEEHSTDPAVRHETGNAYRVTGTIYNLLGRHRDAEQACQAAIALLQPLAAEFPAEANYRADLGWAYHGLGTALQHLGRPNEAGKRWRRCVELWEALATEYPAAVWYRRWQLQVQLELLGPWQIAARHPEAEVALQQALPLLEAQAKDDPAGAWRRQLAGAYQDLGHVLSGKGQGKEAERYFRGALAISEQLAAEFPKHPNMQYTLARAQQLLGYQLQLNGQPREAEQLYRRSIALRTRQVADFPSTPQYRSGLAETYLYLFLLLRAERCFEEAEQVHREGLEQARKLVAEAPNRAWHLRLLMDMVRAHGVMLATQGRPREAEKAFREVLAISQKHLTDFPTTSIRPRVATAFYCLAGVLRDTDRNQEAEGAYRQAVQAYEKEFAESPDAAKQPGYREALATIHRDLASLLASRGRPQEAKELYRKSIELSPNPAAAQNGLARVLATAADPRLRDPELGVELATQAVALAPDQGDYWNTLGLAQYRVGDWQAARTALQKSMELRRGGNSFDWFFLAMAHRRLGVDAEAHQWYGRAVAWMDKHQPGDDELRRFREEAARVLGVQEPKE
jgi:serine/threonine protein kinase/tetratricopeptide (TPR) repeat protein